MDKMLEARIARLERIMNEATDVSMNIDDLIGELDDLNKSNQFDNGNFRWSTAINLLSTFADLQGSDSVTGGIDAKAAERFRKKLSDRGYDSVADLTNEIINAMTARMEDLKAKRDAVKEVLKKAKAFDKVKWPTLG